MTDKENKDKENKELKERVEILEQEKENALILSGIREALLLNRIKSGTLELKFIVAEEADKRGERRRYDEQKTLEGLRKGQVRIEGELAKLEERLNLLPVSEHNEARIKNTKDNLSSMRGSLRVSQRSKGYNNGAWSMREEIIKTQLRVVKDYLDKALHYFLQEDVNEKDSKKEIEQLISEASRIACKLYHTDEIKKLCEFEGLSSEEFNKLI